MPADLPRVTIAAAATLDGAIAPAPLGSQLDRRRLIQLRMAHDASVIGASTLREEDPRLLCPRSPRLRCLVTLSCRLPVDGKAFFRQGDRPLIFAPEGGGAILREEIGERAEVIEVGRVGPSLSWCDILMELRRRGAESVLLEGGGLVNGSALAQGVVDLLEITVVPQLSGKKGVPRLFQWSMGELSERVGLELIGHEVQPTGEIFLRYRVRKGI